MQSQEQTVAPECVDIGGFLCRVEHDADAQMGYAVICVMEPDILRKIEAVIIVTKLQNPLVIRVLSIFTGSV